MTVTDLIAELSTMPRHLPVRVVVGSVIVCDETGDHEIGLSELDATEVDKVRHCGGYVLVEGR